MAEDEAHEVVTGEGYAVGNIAALGDGGGFRKIRPALNVQALGINAIVMPATFAGRRHYHYEQEETYFIHQPIASSPASARASASVTKTGSIRIHR